MAPLKIIVFGATGKQGGSVARALLEDGGKFAVYGITRNPSSASSVEQLGVKLLKGDLSDPASYEDALQGAHGVFLNADFWANYRGNNSAEAKAIEIEQSVAVVDAAKRGGVKHLVYSTLESYKPRQELPHFDSKAEVTAYIRKSGVPATQLFTSYYFSNLLQPFPEENGVKIITLPLPDDTVIPGYNSDQIGLFVRAALRDPHEWVGKDMYACGENMTVGGIAKELCELSGQRFATMGATREDFMNLKGRMDYELWLNYHAFLNHEMKRDPEVSRRIVPEVQDFKQWVMSSRDAQEMWFS